MEMMEMKMKKKKPMILKKQVEMEEKQSGKD